MKSGCYTNRNRLFSFFLLTLFPLPTWAQQLVVRDKSTLQYSENVEIRMDGSHQNRYINGSGIGDNLLLARINQFIMAEVLQRRGQVVRASLETIPNRNFRVFAWGISAPDSNLVLSLPETLYTC